MLRLAPLARAGRRRPSPASIRRKARAAARVALLAGCANEALAPPITQAAIRLLNRHGVEVVVAAGEGCCGSLEHHMGREAGAFAKARANIDAWTREIEGEGLDAILITMSGCGTTVKDYGFMLRTDPAYAEKAAQVSALARDVSEYLAKLGLKLGAPSPALTVAYPLRLLAAARPEGARGNRKSCSRLAASSSKTCRRRICAAARPAPTTSCSRRSPGGCATARSATSKRLAPDVIAAGNIGCITQIASGTAIPVVHTGRTDRLGDRRAGAGTDEARHRWLDPSEERHGKEAQGEEESLQGKEAPPVRRKKAARKHRAQGEAAQGGEA